MMEEQPAIRDTFSDIHSNYLDSIGIKDDMIKKILSYRLLIERLGERDNNDWWKSNLFTEFGRKSLEEVLPKSWTKARIRLALKTAFKVEEENIDEKNFISLFYLGPYFEHILEKELEKINSENEFKGLEDIDVEFDEPCWMDGFKEGNIDIDGLQLPCLGEIYYNELEEDESIEFYAKNLFYAYGKSTKNNLIIPYYVIKNE